MTETQLLERIKDLRAEIERIALQRDRAREELREIKTKEKA